MFSRYFPELSTDDGLQKATKAGIFGALAFAATVLLGLVVVIWTGHPLGSSHAAPAGIGYDVAGAILELLVPLVAAWRFKQHKGLVIGSIALILFMIEVAAKLAAGGAAVGWIVFDVAVTIAMFNGIRGALAYRKLGAEQI